MLEKEMISRHFRSEDEFAQQKHRTVGAAYEG